MAKLLLRTVLADRLTKIALERQIDAAQFERTMMGVKRSPVASVLHPEATQVFKDNYVPEFLDEEVVECELPPRR